MQSYGASALTYFITKELINTQFAWFTIPKKKKSVRICLNLFSIPSNNQQPNHTLKNFGINYYSFQKVKTLKIIIHV